MINRYTLFITFIAIFFIVRMLKYVYLTRNKTFGSYSGKKLIPWNYSENQAEWVSPDKSLPVTEMNGNIYFGKKEVNNTWKNFEQKEVV